MKTSARRDGELHFVGAVPAEIEPFARRFADPRVRFHGPVPQGELVGHYHRAHLFCLPSLEEGMAMVIPQAMASGLAVLATEESGAAEVVRPGLEGGLVRAGSVEALRSGLEQWLADRDALAQAGWRAAQRVRQGFTWKDYGQRVQDTYARVLQERRDERGIAA